MKTLAEKKRARFIELYGHDELARGKHPPDGWEAESEKIARAHSLELERELFDAWLLAEWGRTGLIESEEIREAMWDAWQAGIVSLRKRAAAFHKGRYG